MKNLSQLNDNKDMVTKGYVDTLISNVYLKTQTYNKTELDGKFATKLTQDDLADYITSAKVTEILSTYATDNDLQTEITAVNGKITVIDTKLSDFRTVVLAAQTALQTEDTRLQGEIDKSNEAISEINGKIPNTASQTNQLADKTYVTEQIQKNAARGLSSTADGDSFSSKDVLLSGPWYFQGNVIDSPHTNDYAIVTQDATADGLDVRYNYDGAGWIKFQTFQNGAGFTPTTEQTAAMDSGITSTQVTQIATNVTNITKNANDLSAEQTARAKGDTDLLSKINTETTARENADNDIKSNYVGALTALSTTDKTSIVSAINALKTEISNDKVAKTGDEMSGRLKIARATNGELIELEAKGSGVQFIMDGDNNKMGIVPVKATAAGFNIDATSIEPRLNNASYPYNMGTELYPWTNGYIKNLLSLETINGTIVSEFVKNSDLTTKLGSYVTTTVFANHIIEYESTCSKVSKLETSLNNNAILINTNSNKINVLESTISSKANTNDVYSKTEMDTKTQNIEDRLYILENKPAPNAVYFFLPTQQIVLSSANDKYVDNFETNIPASDLQFNYAQSGLSYFVLESSTSLMYHYVSGTPQNFAFSITYTPTGETIGSGYMCISSNGGNNTKIIWAGVNS